MERASFISKRFSATGVPLTLALYHVKTFVLSPGTYLTSTPFDGDFEVLNSQVELPSIFN